MARLADRRRYEQLTPVPKGKKAHHVLSVPINRHRGEISPDINTAMTSRLLLDLTYGVLADIEAEDLAREASFAQGLRAMIGGILTAS